MSSEPDSSSGHEQQEARSRLSIPPLSPGMIVGARFRLLQTIGSGGFGQVWRAEELLPGGAAIRHVALKLLSPESDLRAWAEEAKLLASFSHPSLVMILAAGLLSFRMENSRASIEVPFVAMELLAGDTLAAVLDRSGPLPWRRVLGWARDVAGALDVIHARGIVHLDLKPANLFVTDTGSIKVLDFGIARRAGVVPPPRTSLPGADPAVATAEFLAQNAVAIHHEAPPAARAAPLPGAVLSGSAHPESGPDGKLGGGASIFGTPGFMAPEVIEQRTITAAADAYALASCIVQLVTGKLPQDVPDPPSSSAHSAERTAFWSEVRQATCTGKLRDLLAVTAPNQSGTLPAGLARLCLRLLSLDPEARGIASGGLRAIFDAVWERPYGIPDPPYLGLSAFGPESEGMLFGRGDDAARLARELTNHGVLVLQGMSGSGKSSLAMAGIVPAIARRDAASGPDWHSLVVRPGVDPDLALSRALESLDPELVEATPAKLCSFCRDRGFGAALVFDQLEELITQADEGRRARFLSFLADAARLPPSAPVRIIATLREDFTSGLLSIEPLGERLRDALRFVGPPTTAAVREIVAEPARLAGVQIEGLTEIAAAVERELREGEGRLPLIGLALAAFWATRKDGVLSAASFREMGGVRKIFATLADGVFERLAESEKIEARALLIELCHEDRTRRSVPRAVLRNRAKNSGAFDRAVAAFIEAKLLVESAGAGALEVVHEFLFSAWDKLDGWIADTRASRRIAAALSEAARFWRDLGRPESRLPGAAEVALAKLAMSDGHLSSDDILLLEEWLGARRHRVRVQRIGWAALVAGGLLVITLAFATWGKMVSEAQQRVNESKQEALLAAAKASENERRAAVAHDSAAQAQAEADRSRAERDRAAFLAKRQQEEFDRLLTDAKSEVQKQRVRCKVLRNEANIRLGVCPAGDPLCSMLDSGMHTFPEDER